MNFRALAVALVLTGLTGAAVSQEAPPVPARADRPAIADLIKWAGQGNVTAQYALGLAYANGDGAAVNYPQAARWFDSAARAGSLDARRHIEFMRQTGLIAADFDPAALAARDLAAVRPAAGGAAAAALSGAFRIQVATVSTEADGPREWKRWQRRFPEMLEPLQVAVVGFETAGGEHLFRVQGGPLDEDGAKNLCAKIKAEGVGCFVIRPQ